MIAVQLTDLRRLLARLEPQAQPTGAEDYAALQRLRMAVTTNQVRRDLGFYPSWCSSRAWPCDMCDECWMKETP